MKIIKVIGLLILVLIMLFLAVSFFLPTTVNIERSIVIETPSSTVFEEVNELKNWEHWAPWFASDAGIELTYSDQTKGKGASFSWTGEKNQKGTLTIIESKENKHLKNKLDFEGMGDNNFGIWAFKETEEGVSVTWGYQGELSFMMRFMGLFFDNMMGEDFEKGLNKLKVYCESKPKEEKSRGGVQVVKLKAQPMYFIKDVTDTSNIGEKLNTIYSEIMDHVKKSGESIIGPAFSIWYDWDEGGTSNFAAGFPVAETKEGKGRVEPGETLSGTFVAIAHKGLYKNFEVSHLAIQNFIAENGYTINGPVMEVYVVGPGQEEDPAKFVTQIYYSVE